MLLKEEDPKTYPDASNRSWPGDGAYHLEPQRSAILEAIGLEGLFDVAIDGVASAELGLGEKPASDIFLEAARRLQVKPEEAIVVEDALSGMEAGRAGKFGLVVGVVRNGGDELRERGADVVVSDLWESDRPGGQGRSRMQPHRVRSSTSSTSLSS